LICSFLVKLFLLGYTADIGLSQQAQTIGGMPTGRFAAQVGQKSHSSAIVIPLEPWQSVNRQWKSSS